jgi:hypothetical protein
MIFSHSSRITLRLALNAVAWLTALALLTPTAQAQNTKGIGVITVKSDRGVAAVQSGIQSVSTSGLAVVSIRYAVLGTDTPLGGQFCTLLAARTDHGISRENPCVSGSVLGQITTSNFMTTGTTGRELLQIPPGITQLAHHRALSSGLSEWYFVRQFASGVYATQLLRLSGQSANRVLTLTRAELAFREGRNAQAVAVVPVDGRVGPLSAVLDYQGSGLLRGRWEVVQPGDPEPTSMDLTPEAALNASQRLQQQRYTTVGRFEQMIGAGSRLTVMGPPANQLPTSTPGRYLILLRLEATPTNTRNDADAPGLDGGASAFPMPVLTYYVQGASSAQAPLPKAQQPLATIELLPMPRPTEPGLLQLHWKPREQAALYRVEITDERGEQVFAARIKGDESNYQVPTRQLGATPGQMSWRVMALDAQGQVVARSVLTHLKLP